MTVRFLAAGIFPAVFAGWLSAQTICPPHIRWQGSFGAGGPDYGTRILQLADGGYLIGGSSSDAWDGVQGNKTSPSYGASDFYLVRLDAQGQKLWDRSFGGANSDSLAALEQTTDGGFLLAGTSYSNAAATSSDFWVVRIDSQGNKLWDRFFNGAGQDELAAARQTADGGFILGGSSRPSFLVAMDFWIVRLDANGNKLWDASFGGDMDDRLIDLQQTSDGGFILGGQSLSDVSGSRTAPSHGNYDYWLVRVDANGAKLWDRAYGGTDTDQLRSLLIAPNGDFLLAGTSSSGVGGNKTVEGFGSQDFWILRLDPVGNILWQRAYGGESYEQLLSATLTGTNGFLLSGSSYSPPSGSKTSRVFRYEDGWVVRIDASGNQIWDASFGTTSYDQIATAIPTAEGGYALVGVSDFVNGNKTSPHFGAGDIWVIRLDPENPGDCDNDGVPNAEDLCGDTPFGALVNSNGCALVQICSCQDWLDHSDYVACVERATAEFQNAGLISTERRAELIAEAQAANCPPSQVVFGLVHVLMTDTLVQGGNDAGYINFLPGTNTFWGSSVLLGEADSGIFIDPGAGGWGSSSPDWFLDGKAYGRFDNGSNGLIVTIHATKPSLESYPVEVDFSPLSPTNITIQQFDSAGLTSEEDVPGSIGYFSINTPNQQNPRVNPFWRMPDGSIGALFEFRPYEDPGFYSIFVRANGPARDVDYVSRVEAIGSGSYEVFSFNDERLGMFGNRHRILNAGRFQAAGRQLTVSRGAIVEFNKATRFETDFLPIDLATNDNPSLFFSTAYGASLQIGNASDGAVQADFTAVWYLDGTNLPPAMTTELKAFRNGILSGSCLVTNAYVLGHFIVSNQSAPRVIGIIATASSNSPPMIAFSVDQLTTCACTNGPEISGTHFEMSPVDPQFLPESISNLNILAGENSAFTITGERSRSAQPRLSITASDTAVTLAWPDNTRLFRLESSTTLPDGFSTVVTEPDYIDNRNQVVLPRDATGSRFFRLRSGPD